MPQYRTGALSKHGRGRESPGPGSSCSLGSKGGVMNAYASFKFPYGPIFKKCILGRCQKNLSVQPTCPSFLFFLTKQPRIAPLLYKPSQTAADSLLFDTWLQASTSYKTSWLHKCIHILIFTYSVYIDMRHPGYFIYLSITSKASSYKYLKSHNRLLSHPFCNGNQPNRVAFKMGFMKSFCQILMNAW